MNAKSIEKELLKFSKPDKLEVYLKFFKTGKGEYGEGDKFLGVVVPDVRIVAKANKSISFDELEKLISSQYHECRLCALVIMVENFKKNNPLEKKQIVDFYLSHTQFINNWDLVDFSSKSILGEYLVKKDDERRILYDLAKSDSLWDQRIAVISTHAFIKRDDFTDAIALSEELLHHKHDLMHKAIGWTLREIGKKDKDILINFLDQYYKEMPRTMLRYSIEQLSVDEKAYYMKK